jgi:hypothetical protein
LLEEVPHALQERQVPADVAAQVGQLLGAIQAFRFVPEGGPEAGAIVDQTATLVRRLGRLSTGGKG